MLGNDIIDLKLAATQSNWQRKGYIEKIFTKNEQGLIANATDQNQMVWLLWSMKEAAYKILSPIIGERFYSPKSLACELDFNVTTIVGNVTFKAYNFDTFSKATADFINTTATAEHNRKLEHYIFIHQDSYLKEFNERSKKFELSKNEANLPTIQYLSTGEFGPASVSHHGRYVSIVHPTQFEPV